MAAHGGGESAQLNRSGRCSLHCGCYREGQLWQYKLSHDAFKVRFVCLVKSSHNLRVDIQHTVHRAISIQHRYNDLRLCLCITCDVVFDL